MEFQSSGDSRRGYSASHLFLQECRYVAGSQLVFLTTGAGIIMPRIIMTLPT